MRRDGTAAAGIGLRGPHVAEIMCARPELGFLEVHAENYLGGAPAVTALEALRRDYPVSLHGVGLSLGGADRLDRRHLARFRALIDRVEPMLVSEHLSWSGIGGRYLNDLLPLPLTEESLEIVCAHVDEAQAALGRRLLIENPATYLRFRHSTIPEAEFLAALSARTGCGILCDVNNLYVNAENFGFDPAAYLDALPAQAIEEIHLAGHHRADADGAPILIDDHGAPVAAPVWDLYADAIARFGRVPTLVEWDSNLPPLGALLVEAAKADGVATAIERQLHAVA
ncbi:MAG TPA: DUF692 domain-containing protein [Stellaceae bacterium]|nr:DUF692 domain-containing protein [Stellaceae bacterium]